jgi:hypothetical protein
MIAARMCKEDDGTILVMLVLEPGNLEKLKRGEPIRKFLQELIPELPYKIELMYAYTPDIEWVTKQMLVENAGNNSALKLAEIIEQSLTRPPIVRDSKSAEEMERAI